MAEPRAELSPCEEKRRDARETKIIKDIKRDEERLQKARALVEKINADSTKLDKTKRLARANAEVVRLQGNIIKLEKQLSAYVSRQRLSFARLLEERDQNGNLDRDTAELVATLIGKPKGKKTKRRKRRSRTKRR
jgi:hypothetical protein